MDFPMGFFDIYNIHMVIVKIHFQLELEEILTGDHVESNSNRFLNGFQWI